MKYVTARHLKTAFNLLNPIKNQIKLLKKQKPIKT